MNRQTILKFLGLSLIIVLLLAVPIPALAQESAPGGAPEGAPEGAQGRAQESVPESAQPQPLSVFTEYPSQVIGFGEVVTVTLKFQAGQAQIVELQVRDLPEGWNASFRGGSRVVESVYVDGQHEVEVDLRLEPPADIKSGKYVLEVVASGEQQQAVLPLYFTIEEKLPPRMSLEVNGLPVKRGASSVTFNFSADLKNEGGEDLLVALAATQPENMQVTIESSGQEVTELELAANETKALTIKADPLVTLQAGRYPFTVQATAGDITTDLELAVEVVGEGTLTVTAPDGRLSGQAYAGRDNALKIALVNTGTAPLRGIELSSSEPTGWTVSFDQTQIAEIPAGERVEVTAQIKPPEKAIAGDYIVTVNARPLESEIESAEFRITVRTATLWGVAGIGLIALAVGVVGIAVVRFGRR